MYGEVHVPVFSWVDAAESADEDVHIEEEVGRNAVRGSKGR